MIEHEQHAHVHSAGHGWADLVIAGCAILISVVSVAISIHHGHTMERLVETNEKQVKAATLPILRYESGNLDVQRRTPAVHFDISNGGTGPAIVEWLTLKWDGQNVNSANDLVRRCCEAGHNDVVRYTITNTVSGQTLAAGQTQTILYIPPAGMPRALYTRLESEARFKVQAEACYCSVLDECWITNFEETRPRDVASCTDKPKERW